MSAAKRATKKSTAKIGRDDCVVSGGRRERVGWCSEGKPGRKPEPVDGWGVTVCEGVEWEE
jgi:hypothetical protein